MLPLMFQLKADIGRKHGAELPCLEEQFPAFADTNFVRLNSSPVECSNFAKAGVCF